MKKINSKICLICLAGLGMLSCLLPWSGIYTGSIPPGDLPNKIFYGYQTKGLIGSACFGVILLLCLLTSVRKPMSPIVKLINLLLLVISLAVCLWDIVRIMLQAHMMGSVPFLKEGPFVMGILAISMIVIITRTVRKKS